MPPGNIIIPQWPILVYRNNPPINGLNSINVTTLGEVQVNFDKVSVPFYQDKTIIDLSKSIPFQDNDIIIKEKDSIKTYFYNNLTLKIAPNNPLDFPIKYVLEEYQGEVDENNLPHGKGVLKIYPNTILKGNFVHGLPNGTIDQYLNGEHYISKTYTEGVSNGPFISFKNGFVKQEGWIVNNTNLYTTKEYVYALNRRDSIYGAPKYIKYTTYDTINNSIQKVKTKIVHTKRIWEYEDNTKIYVDKNKASMFFPNGDVLTGPFTYINYDEIYVGINSEGRGYFEGECSYYFKKDGQIIKGEYKDRRFKNGDIDFTFFDEVQNKVITRTAEYDDGEIRVPRTNVFDVIFSTVHGFMESGEMDIWKMYLHSINTFGVWLETAMGTSIPPVGYTDTYSWEDEYKTVDEIYKRDPELLTPYEIEKLSYKEYTFTYKEREIILKLRNPTNGEVRMEPSGEGEPESSRNGGSRLHMAWDIISEVGGDIVSPVSGIIVNHGYHRLGSPMRTIWIDTNAETGEKIRVKLMYATLKLHIDTEIQNENSFEVNQGDIIGVGQNLYEYYDSNPETISPHIHMEIHIREDYMKWKESIKIATPPFPLPVSPNRNNN